MTYTRRHRRYRKHRGGSSDVQDPVVSQEIDLEMKDVADVSSVPSDQTGGRRSRRRRNAHRSRGSRKSGGRRSRRGGFMVGLGAALQEALVPLGLTYYTINKSRRNRNKRGGRDDVA